MLLNSTDPFSVKETKPSYCLRCVPGIKKKKNEHLLEYGIGLESFYTPEFVCGEEGKTSAVTFHQSLEIGFLK